MWGNALTLVEGGFHWFSSTTSSLYVACAAQNKKKISPLCTTNSRCVGEFRSILLSWAYFWFSFCFEIWPVSIAFERFTVKAEKNRREKISWIVRALGILCRYMLQKIRVKMIIATTWRCKLILKAAWRFNWRNGVRKPAKPENVFGEWMKVKATQDVASKQIKIEDTSLRLKQSTLVLFSCFKWKMQNLSSN